jgi:uncharacterized delta-60 repeat protein
MTRSYSPVRLLLFCLCASLLHAAPGDLDITFGGSGKVIAGVGGGSDHAGYTSGGPSASNICLARYNMDGSLDPTFNGTGKVLTQFDFVYNKAFAVKLQSDGKIVVAGEVQFSTSSTPFFALARYNTDGSLDHSFGTNGLATDGTSGGARSLLIQSDGKLVASGNGTTVRYGTTGALDTSFGTKGVVSQAVPIGTGSTLQSDSKILLCGTSGSSIVVTRLNTNGTVDTAFGSNGVVTTSQSYQLTAATISYQPAGTSIQNPAKIVVAGQTNTDSFIVRYNIDGSLDTSFNGTGELVLHIGNAGSACGISFHFSQSAPDRIYVGGYYSSGFGFNFYFYVARLLLNGSLDTAWGNSGVASNQLPATPNGMDTANGKIVLAGTTSSLSGPSDFALAKFNFSDGSIDTTFNGTGKRIDDIGNETQVASAVAIQADGKIVAGGSRFSQYASLYRFNADGSFDTSFNGTGWLYLTDKSAANAVAVQPDGKILLGGYDTSSSGVNSFLVARFNSDGTPDTTFNGSGMAITPIDIYGLDYAYALVLQPDGKIVLSGASYNNSFSTYRFAAARYNTNGSLDTTFNGTGKVITAIGSGNSSSAAATLQGDGKLILAGYSLNGSRNAFTLARYNTNGSLDPNFGGAGTVVNPISGNTNAIVAVAMNGNKIVAAGANSNGITNHFAVARYNVDGSLDTTFNGTGKVVTTIGTSDQLNCVKVQPDGKVIAAGYTLTANSDYDFATVRYKTDGSLDGSFDAGGIRTVPFGDGTFDYGYGMTLDAIGRLVVVGQSNGVVAMTRLLGDPLLRFTSITRPSSTQVSLFGLGVPGVSQSLQYATALDGSWTPIVNITPDVNGQWSRTNMNIGSYTTLFFQLVLP